MSKRIDIAEIERLLATPSGGWRITEMTSTHSALPALLRLARAAKAMADTCPLPPDPHEPGEVCPDCDLRRALEPFDFGSKEPAR